MDFIEFDNGFTIAKLNAPASTHGQRRVQSGVRGQFGVTVVGVNRVNKDFEHPQPETCILVDDLLDGGGPVARWSDLPAVPGKVDQAPAGKAV